MTEIQPRMDAFFQTRSERAAHARAEFEYCETISAALRRIVSALDGSEIRPAASLPTRSEWRELAELRKCAEQFLNLMECCRETYRRFSRRSVCIGVIGQARSGAIRLLQSLTGLGDLGILVSLARATTHLRVTNSPSNSRAIIETHSESSFLQEVVDPLYRFLGAVGRPTSIAEFRSWRPTSTDITVAQTPIMRMLIDLQRDLDTYLPHLAGPDTVVVDVNSLNSWFTDGHQYAAIRNICIEAARSFAPIAQMSFVMLPLVGESGMDFERNYISYLRSDVDAMIQVKRASYTSSFWGNEDHAIVRMVSEAMIPWREFTTVVISNVGDVPDEVATAIRTRIEGQFGMNLRIQTVDISSEALVQELVAAPMFADIDRRLSATETGLMANVSSAIDNLARRSHQVLTELENTFPTPQPTLRSPRTRYSIGLTNYASI